MELLRIDRICALSVLLPALSLSYSACANVPAAVVPATSIAPIPVPAATTSAAQAVPSAQTITAPAASTVKPKLICEDADQIGTHFRKRICLTLEQVEARRKAAQKAFQNDPHNTCSKSGCLAEPMPGPPEKR
jgi:hypothetical protein